MWGIPYLFTSIAVEELSPFVIVMGRCVIGTLALLPFAIRSGDLRAALKRWPYILAYAAIEMVIAWLLLVNAQQYLPSSLAGLLVAALPIFATVLALLLRIERRITLRRIIGLLLGLTGVGILSVVGAGGYNGFGVRPVLQVLMTAMCYAVGPMIIAKKLQGISPLAVNAVSLTFASIMHAPLGLTNLPARMPSGGAIGSVLVLGLVPTAIAFVVFFKLIAEVGPAPSTVITYINPGVALLAGIIFLGEQMTRAIWIGFPMVLLGAFLATWRIHSARDSEIEPLPG